ncbi:class I SAM-dependent methyltransferase [Picrophilus oshimae]|uniref:Methyltransferase domain-containing protein n=1 Tax=Picrophilus torridus (strain ATCC 700027 / DSM 9790 / JCM 10055 / NBRC 100828 / KAW 2/3) TaxID=1122961 RepID=A0A8G2FXJ8_PICTO|nr:class I SAM-dependent methyltransferase [Picrophilus oshimae]SMD31278.1 hypothetical protein SAMN02745355_1206 [Picrophilus oshimae DSM 9789]
MMVDFLRLCLDDDFRYRVNLRSEHFINLIRSGYAKNKIIRNEYDKYIYEIAKSRIKVSGKFSKYNELFFDEYAASYSTPEIPGIYRSKRLKNNDILDLGSGAGMQDIFFSMNSHVTGIEIDENRYLMSELNKIPYKSKAEFINGDANNFLKEFDGIIFSDPLRPGSSMERTVNELIPNPLKIISKYKNKYAFDLPPQMSWDNIIIPGEKEYISINGKLNRLTVYSMDLSLSASSAVMLPRNLIIRGEPGDYKFEKTDVKKYIYLPDISIIYARLLNEISHYDLGLLNHDQRRYILTSYNLYNDFPGEIYRYLFSAHENDLVKKLKENDAKRIFFRFNVDDYYKKKNYIEMELNGSRDIYIFKSDDFLIGAEKINFSN